MKAMKSIKRGCPGKTLAAVLVLAALLLCPSALAAGGCPADGEAGLRGGGENRAVQADWAEVRHPFRFRFSRPCSWTYEENPLCPYTAECGDSTETGNGPETCNSPEIRNGTETGNGPETCNSPEIRNGTENGNSPETGNATETGNSPETAEAAGSGDVLPYEAQVARLVNDIRAQHGLPALELDPALCNGARLKSRDMREAGYFSHTSPTYGTPFQMMKSLGISYRTAGENIAFGYPSPQSVVDGWMNSDGHRANILGSGFTRIGVGYETQGHYWTQWFIG